MGVNASVISIMLPLLVIEIIPLDNGLSISLGYPQNVLNFERGDELFVMKMLVLPLPYQSKSSGAGSRMQLVHLRPSYTLKS